MVSLRRHFAPNPVSASRTHPSPECQPRLFGHTRYDGLGRRITKTTAGPTTRHFYYSDRWQVLEERLGDSSYAACQYVWGLRYVDDLVLRDRDADGNSGTGGPWP